MATYIAYAINYQGARVDVGIDMAHINGGAEFDTVQDAENAAKSELAAGWKVLIEDADTGEPIKEFYTSDF